MKAKTDLEPDLLEFNGSTSFESIKQRSIGFSSTGSNGITPLFRLKGISKSWWGGKEGKLKERGLRDDLDEPKISPLGDLSSLEHSFFNQLVKGRVFSGENIHVLSIGIDKYAHPDIPNLNECVSDSIQLKKTLQSLLGIPEKQYKVLLNEAATRDGIITAFRSHFSHLKVGDTAVLHFSGHGSEEPAQQAFIDAGWEVPHGQIEVLVCQDSRQAGVYNIADKELRWLVHELQYPKEDPPRPIHFVAILDCCHSGSLFRQEKPSFKARLHNFTYEARPLKAYLNGKYVDHLKHGSVSLPTAHYISLTACSPTELAGEVVNEGGIFTTALCQLLNGGYWAGRFPTYGEMHALLRDQVATYSGHKQLPQLEYSGAIDPNGCFLQMGKANAARHPLLTLRGEKWGVGIGAIHGLDNEAAKDQEVPIYRIENTTSPCAWARVVRVEVEYTRVKIISGRENLQPGIPYLVGLFAPKLPVQIEGFPQKINVALQKAWNQERFQQQFLASPLAKYQLEEHEDHYAIYRKLVAQPKELIYGIQRTHEGAATQILEKLEAIARWEQLKRLSNPRQSVLSPKDVILELEYTDFNSSEHFVTKRWDDEDPEAESSQQITIPFDPAHGGIPYRVYVSLKPSVRVDSYFYLIYLGWKYKIEQKHEAYNQALYGGERLKLYDSYAQQTGLGFLEEDRDEIIETFLLIGSQERLMAPSVLEQLGFANAYGRINPPDERRLKHREIGLKQERAFWMVKRFELRIRRM